MESDQLRIINPYNTQRISWVVYQYLDHGRHTTHSGVDEILLLPPQHECVALPYGPQSRNFPDHAGPLTQLQLSSLGSPVSMFLYRVIEE